MGIVASNNPNACQSCGCDEQASGQSLFLGNYPSLEILNTSQPNPQPGSYAYITISGRADDMAVWDNGDLIWRNIGQNNIGKTFKFYLQPGTQFTINTGVQLLNNGGPFSAMTFVPFPLSISEKESQIFFQFGETINGITKKYIYGFSGGKGLWGKNGTSVDTGQFTLIDTQGVTVDDIPTDFTTELGEVPEGGFLTAANSEERNLTDDTRPYYFSYFTGNKLYYALFTSSVHGIYGGGSVFQFTEDDFAIITDSDATEEITRTDQLDNTGEDGSSPFATVAQVNGMTITANQATSEIYLRNASGEILATLNVAFLNNEGTTFFYNEATQMLELKNDAGDILSSVPVSAFVANLIQQVSFSGSTPYVLEFKDAEGEVVDSVTISISNVQGLEAALAGKISTSHPANNVTDGRIANWNTAFNWGNHAGLYLPLGADIPDAADLNTYIQTGIYIQRFNFQAAAGTNYPAPLKGFLEVMKSADALISQKYHVGGGDSNTYFIRVFGNTWTGWKKLLDSGDITNNNIANWNAIIGKYVGFAGNAGYAELFSGDMNALPMGNLVHAISGLATNQPANIGTPRSLFTFGARSDSDSGLTSDLLIGTLGVAVRNRTNNTWRKLWSDSDFNAALKADLVDGKVPASQLPSFVDDVLEFANLAAFPATGESGKVYIANDTNKTYRWSGSAYVIIGTDLALGETSATAYPGDRGKTAYDHSQTQGNPHNTQIGDIPGLQDYINNAIAASRPYRVYTALLKQTGTNAPVATVLENTLGFDPVWSYDNVGIYNLNHVGGFPAGKVICFTTMGVPFNGGANHEIRWDWENEDLVSITSMENNNQINTNLSDASFELRIYN